MFFCSIVLGGSPQFVLVQPYRPTLMKKLRSFLLLMTLTLSSAWAMTAPNNRQVSAETGASVVLLPAEVVPDGIY
jgi:hypothetical protein